VGFLFKRTYLIEFPRTLRALSAPKKGQGVVCEQTDLFQDGGVVSVDVLMGQLAGRRCHAVLPETVN
jgi:hypothetical protein